MDRTLGPPPPLGLTELRLDDWHSRTRPAAVAAEAVALSVGSG